jgi:hypothetical protein
MECGGPDDIHCLQCAADFSSSASGEPSTEAIQTFLDKLLHTDPEILVWIRSLLQEREARATPPALDAARSEIQANRAQGVQWDPPVSKQIERWYAEGYDRGLRDADAILARLSTGDTE